MVKNAARDERDRLKQAGLRVDVPTAHYGSREEVIDAVLANLSAIPHVRIIPLTGASAAEALKDQVLVREPAKVKGVVKSGASDSAWLRDVVALASSEEIMIVSSDGDVKKAFAAWRRQVPLIRKREQLRAALFDITVDDGHAQAAIVSYFLKQLPADVPSGDDSSFDIGRIVGLESAIARRSDGDGTSLSTYGASVTRLVALAGIADVTVEHDVPDDTPVAPEPRGYTRPDSLGTAKHHVAYATVFFLAQGEATVQTPLNDGDPEVSVIPYENVMVRAQLSFRFTDGAITAAAAETDATALLIQHEYDDDDEAFHALTDALTLVPGLELDTDPFGDSDADLNGSIRGIPAQVSVDARRDSGDWSLSVALWHPSQGGQERELDAEAEVACTYNPDSWWGGSRDGFQGPDGYQISVTAPGLSTNHGVWAVPAWLISRIDWSAFDPNEPA
ncbi:hypothetical protein OG612_45025 (plasmid) [Streptomyces sp. NBC_01527]|uniref:hypothetical protein n=1 Tax=Streptomyces sp. NBC_01527 TaxID=2903894 RepID=UPI0038673F37